MPVEGFGGDVEDVFLQVLEGFDAEDFFAAFGVADDEVAESEVVDDGFSEVDGEFLGVLVDEGASELADVVGVLGLGAFDDEGEVGVAFAEFAGEADACLGVFAAFAHEGDVADDSEDVVAVAVIEGEGFLIVAGEHDFGAPSHAEHLFVFVEGFGGEFARLFEDEFVDDGEHRGVESDGVFDEEDHLDPDAVDVVVGVHLVLEELDDGQEEVDVAQPGEDVVYPGEVFVGEPAGYFLGEGGQDDDGHPGVEVADAAGACEGLADVVAGHHDDEVEALDGEDVEGFGGVEGAGDARGRGEVERGVFEVELFFDAAVLLHHEGVVGRGDEKHVEYPFLHQRLEGGVLEIELAEGFVVGHGRGTGLSVW